MAASPQAAINFTIGGTLYFFTRKVEYYVYADCIQIDASVGNGGIFSIFIPVKAGDSATTEYASLISEKSELDYFIYSCDQALTATAIFNNGTLSGTFYGTIQYDDTYAYYPTVQGSFFNVPLAE